VLPGICWGISRFALGGTGAAWGGLGARAAPAMSAYQAASGSALASAPRTAPAPNIVNPGVGEANSAVPSNPVSSLVQLLQSVVNFYEQGANQFSALLQNPVGGLQQIITAFATNPAAALAAHAPLLWSGA